MGPSALTFTRARGHHRGMEARRRAGPAAIAAALIGVGLALYRPQQIPELTPGSRASQPRPGATLAATIAWPPAPGLAPASAASAGYAVKPHPAVEKDVWRDALADRSFLTGARATSAASVSSSAPHHGRTLRESPSAAETDPVHTTVSSILHAASRRRGLAPVTPRLRTPTDGRTRPIPRRVPLAQGPAASDDDDEPGRPTVEPRPAGTRSDRAAWTRRRTRSFPLFRPPRRATRPPRKAALRRRARPLLLSTLLGRGALRPPPASIATPDLSKLKGRRPLLLPDGSPVPVRPYELDRIEALDPRRAGAECRRRARHWDEGPRWHEGAARGIISDARWLWLWKEETRWWAVRTAEEAPLLRHQGLWWSKQRGVWFALHDGELWSWRRFSDWDAEGLIRLADGVELVYSADFSKAAVITPGAGAVLYDARTGAELGEWLEHELPRHRPRAPAGLRLPRGI